jgi:hypothetical protein
MSGWTCLHIGVLRGISVDLCMDEWDPAVNDFVLRCNSCWRTNKHVKKIIRTSREKLDVAIELDLGADVVDRLYQQFWRLQRLYQLNLVYKEIRRYLPSFLNLFKLVKQQRMMSEQDVVEALKFGKELPHLKEQFLLLVDEINSLEYKKIVRAVLSALQNQINTTRNSLKNYQSAENS